MLVNLLLVISTCLSSCMTSQGQYKKDYEKLLNSLYNKYKLFKRDHSNYLYNNNDENHRHRIYKKGNIALKSNRRSTLRHDVDNDATKRSNVLALHMVTAVHDDDDDVTNNDAEKRGFAEPVHDGSPDMDIISPVSDNEQNVVNIPSLHDGLVKPDVGIPSVHDAIKPVHDGIKPVHDDEEDAMQKHIVPIHDDFAPDRLFDFKDLHPNTPAESKTFFPEHDKRVSRNDDIVNSKTVNRGENNISDEDGDDDDDDDDDDDLKDIFDTDGTYHINNINNDKEESVLEVEGNRHSNKVEEKLKESENDKTGWHVLKMPGVSPETMDTYYCFAKKLPPDDHYIVEFQPLAEKQVAHHMLLFGCEEPYAKDSAWKCREMTPVCNGRGQSILYAWAKDAQSLKMPTNVGFHVGGDSGYNYLVLQVHYLHVDKFKNSDKTDDSGVRYFLDKTYKKFLAGIYLLGNGFDPIPPHKTKAHIDMGCYYSYGPIFFPFRFRVHAHKLGVVITGYRVRKGNWTLIGRGDPQRPQAFNPVFHDIDVEPGDTIMGRCTYNSTSRNDVTYIGATHSDEMCNFYIMYFYDSTRYKRGPGEFPCDPVDKASKKSPFKHFPADSDIPLATMEEANRLHFARQGVLEMEYQVVHDWPVDGMKDGDLPLTIGQVTGVDLTADNSQVVILHRGDRFWGMYTFDRHNVLNETYRKKAIAVNPLVWLDRKTGAIIRAAGSDMFYMPHGITIDRNGNIWITDVGSHQVYKLSKDMKVELTLGQKFAPGHHGPDHFCKPTDVAVMKNGDFFVSDGYCNNRVVKFNSLGKMLLQISADTNPNKGIFPSPEIMSVVHSLSLDHKHKCLYVADRENGRILIFNATSGKYLKQIPVEAGAVYAVEYSLREGGVLHFVTGPLNDEPVDISGYTYSLMSNSVVSKWAPTEGFSLPHDLAVSSDNHNLFVAEINPYKIWKFQKQKTRP